MLNGSLIFSDYQDDQYSVFTIDQLKLVVSRNSILSIETILDLEPLQNENNSGCLSEFIINNISVPIFGINDDLDLLRSFPASRRACLLLKSDSGKPFGIAIDTINTLENIDISIHELPGFMLFDYSPITSVLQTDEKFYGLIDNSSLASLLNVDIYYDTTKNTQSELIASNA